MRHQKRSGWLVSVTTPEGSERASVRTLYHAAIPCSVAAIQAVTAVSRARTDAIVEVHEALAFWEIVGLELKPGEARLASPTRC